MLGIELKTARTAWAHAAVYATVALLILVAWVIRKPLLVFATALMVAYLLYPLVDALDRRLPWKARALAVILPFALVFGLLAGFGLIIKKPLLNEYHSLVEQIRHKGFKQELADWRPLDLDIGQYILNEYSQSDIVNMLPQLERTLGTTVRYLFNLFIIPLLSFFILKDGRMIRDGFLDMFDDRKQAESALRDAHVLLLDYMRAVLFLCLTTLVSFTIALTLLRVRYAILLAFAAFALEFVPLVGPLTAGVLILGVSMFNKYQYSLLWIVLFLVVYRLLQDYALSPHLMRKGVKLHPLLLLFGIFAGGEIGGIVGIFLSVPVLALLRLVFYEWRQRSALSGAPVGAG